MPKSDHQKLKILYIMDELLRRSDEAHPVSTKALTEHLAANDIAAERKSIYSDIAALKQYGLDIERNDRGWYIASRTFELPELKLLVDSVQASKFITLRKTNALIRKLETLTSEHEARLLQRQVYVANRVKSMNETIYYGVDRIHDAISRNRKIRFRYFEYTVSKVRRFRRDGARYTVSPLGLTWNDENYYLIAYDSASALVKHFRVDKMEDISITEEPREGQEAFGEKNMGEYTRGVFGMFSGTRETVRMRFDAHLAGAVLDRLGQDAMLVPDGADGFTVQAEIVPSPQFFAWLTGFGTDAKLLGPESVVRAMAEHIRAVAAQYSDI